MTGGEETETISWFTTGSHASAGKRTAEKARPNVGRGAIILISDMWKV